MFDRVTQMCERPRWLIFSLERAPSVFPFPNLVEASQGNLTSVIPGWLLAEITGCSSL
jgi:hypothetical protein